jgi:hypothetical protein
MKKKMNIIEYYKVIKTRIENKMKNLPFDKSYLALIAHVSKLKVRKTSKLYPDLERETRVLKKNAH